MVLFSVRSAYHVQWQHKFGNNTRMGCASGTGNNQVWKTLWDLDIPAKIKNFGWRVLHGIIPCRAILANRHVGNSESCPVGEVACEDIKHMMFTCPRAKEVWCQLGLWERLEGILNEDRSGSVLLQEILRRKIQSQILEESALWKLSLLGVGIYGGRERRSRMGKTCSPHTGRLWQ